LPNECIERRLAAILAADVAGYSRLVGADEEGALARFNAHVRELIQPSVRERRGRIIRTMGDSVLVEFPSVVEALQCAVEMQRAMAERNVDVPHDKRMEFRIGINVGDIIIESGDIYGDGVNIAARLEAIAEPGGICVSDDAYRQVRDKLKIPFEDGGEQRLKNIVRPVRIYRARLHGGGAQAAPRPASPEKPSIAVLPFQNMSGDPEQEYFADGMVEDIITDLSRFRLLFVIARNSSFTYKGRAVDVKQVGRELGVRYVLEGSVRKAGNRVRITGQLIDASTGAHLWAERFDGALEDVFDLQDQVTSSVVSSLTPKLEQAEIERARRKPTENLEAYDYYLRGIASFHKGNRKGTAEALELLNKAIELDPDFATAYGMAAWCYATRMIFDWMVDRRKEMANAARLARRAASLGRDDATALYPAGFALAYAARDYDTGIALVDRALLLNPNLGGAWYVSGWVRVLNGEHDLAIEHFSRVARLSPFDPWIWGVHVGKAYAHFFAGRSQETFTEVEQGLRDRPNYLPAIAILAANGALSGRMDQAKRAIARLRELDPALRIPDLQDRMLLRLPVDLARLAEGLRKAGLPE
jgi:TolB-like protein/tetratricopeptide (TPR) repeat protein